MNTTTRCFPRTLAEAFPDERACAIDAPRRPAIARLDTIAGWLMAVAIGIAGGWCLVVFS